MNELFRKAAQRAAVAVGSPAAFVVALSIVGLWGLCGPACHFSDTWQLVINTSTTVVTFLIVFLIQNGQNRDAKAIHLKLDELLRAIVEARNGMVNLEELSDEKLELFHQEFRGIREVHSAAFAGAVDAKG